MHRVIVTGLKNRMLNFGIGYHRPNIAPSLFVLSCSVKNNYVFFYFCHLPYVLCVHRPNCCDICPTTGCMHNSERLCLFNCQPDRLLRSKRRARERRSTAEDWIMEERGRHSDPALRHQPVQARSDTDAPYAVFRYIGQRFQV